MKITVAEEAVRKNVQLFLIILSRSLASEQRAFTAYVHSKTGSLQFDKTQARDPHWHRIFVRLEGTQNPQFTLVDERNQVFRYDTLSGPASRVIMETFKVLNVALRQIGVRDTKQALRAVTQMEISKDVVHEAWHQVDRLGAEKILLSREPGAFLFRKDSYAALLEQELQKTLPMPIQCMTISYLEAPQKVTDRTIVKKGEEWLFYNDDPSLSIGPFYPSVEIMLSGLQPRLTAAVLHQHVDISDSI